MLKSSLSSSEKSAAVREPNAPTPITSPSCTNGTASIEVPGFYDGEGVYRIRFMPPTQGPWRYETRSNKSELSGTTPRNTFAFSSRFAAVS